MIRIIVSLMVFVVAIVLAILSLSSGWLISLASIMTGFYLSCTIIIGLKDATSNYYLNGLLGVIMVLGVFGTLINSRGLDKGVVKAYVAATEALELLSMNCRETSEIRSLEIIAKPACASQNSSNQVQTIMDLIKVHRLKPLLSMADSAISINTPRIEYCVAAMRAIENICPNAFSTMLKDDRSLLFDLSVSR